MRISRRGKIKRKHKLWIFIAFLLIVVLGVYLFFQFHVNPIIIDVSQAQIRSLTSKAVNSAVHSVFNSTNAYDQMIEITTDNAGKITMFQVKSATINKLNKEIGRTAQQNLELIGSEGVDIPFGTLTGIPSLVGVGPEIAFRITPIGSIQSEFNSEFTSAGINQTNHRIYLNIEATVSLIMPTARRELDVMTHVLVCESVIIGEVPETYLKSSNLDEMLNLVPS